MGCTTPYTETPATHATQQAGDNMTQEPDATLEDEARLGRHIVSVAEDASAQLDLLAPIFRAGLGSECQCLFIADRTPPQTLEASLGQRGCDIAGYLETGQFVIETSDQLYLRGGCFEPDRVLAAFAEATAAAGKSGFRGLCVSGELNWLCRGMPGSERVLEYEFRVNYLDGADSATLVCLYDGRTLPGWIGRELDKIHPLVHRDGQVAPSADFVTDAVYAAQLPLAQELEPPADSLSCEWLAELVSAHADGELMARRARELAVHAADCPTCRAWTAAVGRLKRGMHTLQTEAPVPDGFWEVVHSRLQPPEGSE